MLQADGERALAEFAPASTADGSPADAEMVSNHVCLICLHARACLYVYVWLWALVGTFPRY